MGTHGMIHSLLERYSVLCALLFISLAVLVPGVFAQTPMPPATDRQPILSAAEVGYPPFSIVREDGRVEGFAVELLRAALLAMGREVVFRTGPWEEVKGWLENGEVQALPLVGRTPEREAAFDFTFPYMSLHGAIVVRQNTTGIDDLRDLRGRRVAVMKGDNAEEFLLREDRGIEVYSTATFEQALQELSEGGHEAVVMQRLVALRLIQETGLKDLRIISKPIEDFRQDFCFAVRKGDSALLALLNEGLSLVMADGTYRRLHAKWFAALELPVHRRIVVGGDHNFPPFEYLGANGRPTGFVTELTRAIAREANLDIVIRLGPWAQVMEDLEQGRIDVIQGMFFSPERNIKFDFTQPHAIAHYVGVVRKGEGRPPITLEDLEGKSIVVQRGDVIHDFLVANGFEDRLSLVETQKDVLRELASGKHDCGLAARISILHLIREFGWTNLEPGRSPLGPPMEYGYAVGKGQKALLATIGEALSVLEQTGEYRRIHDKWLGIYKDEPFSYASALRHFAMGFIPVCLILLLVFLWSWSLRKQVAGRTKELQQSEEQFRSLVEGAPDAIFVQTEHRFAYLNTTACRLFGADSPDQLLGRPVMERFHPSVREAVRERIRLLNEEKQPVPLSEQIYLRLDGTEVPVEVSAVPVIYEGSDGALVFVRDITERKQSEEALRRKQAMLARTESIAHIGSWEWDPATDTTAWSDELFSIFQRDPAAGAPPFARHSALFPPEDMAPLKKVMKEALTDGAPYKLEVRVLRPDGTIRHCFAQGYGEKDADGKVIRLYGTLQDITDFKLAQERIEHLNRVLRAIRDVNQLIVQERDRNALIQKGCRILVDNRGYEAALIVLTDENDRPVSHGLAGTDQTVEVLDTMLQRGELPSCCFLAREAEGIIMGKGRQGVCKSCPAAVLHTDTFFLTAPMAHGDTVFGYIIVSLKQSLGENPEEQNLFNELAGDFAYALSVLKMEESRVKMKQEQESLQSQLLQAQKLEAIGRLAGGVAHDYNNMLGVIMGYAEMGMYGLDPQNPFHNVLTEILKAAKRSASITRQLLAFARKQTISPKVLDLNEAVETMLKMLRRLIGEDIELAWLSSPDLWPVKMDPAQIDQILANLCVNARDAIDGVGKVTIETHNVTLNEAYCAVHEGAFPGDFVVLAVSDSGCGMDQEMLGIIFEPFFTTKSVGKGTGLGLSTVYGIVKQNNGFINVYSEPHLGTTFKIYLPRHQGDSERDEGADEREVPSARGETVLLVEDEASILTITSTMLEKLGYRVLATDSTAEAMKLAREYENEIHLLLTDVVMPDMNGKELAAGLKSTYPKMKTLFMSGYTANAIAHRGVLDQGVNFLPKPFSFQELAFKVRAVLDGK